MGFRDEGASYRRRFRSESAPIPHRHLICEHDPRGVIPCRNEALSHRDCNHSTAVYTDDRLPLAIPRGFWSPGSWPHVPRQQNFRCGGYVTVSGWMNFFLCVSVLSLMVAVIFARQVIGFVIGTASMRRIFAAMKEGASTLLKMRNKAATVVAGLLSADIRIWADGARGRRRSQPDAAGFVDGEFSGHERTCAADDRIAVLRRWIAVWAGDLCAAKESAGSSHDARNFRDDL